MRRLPALLALLGALAAVPPPDRLGAALAPWCRRERVELLVLDLQRMRRAFVSDPAFFEKGLVPVGSLLKPIALLAMESAGVPTVSRTVNCPPSDPREAASLSCWDHRGHGRLSRAHAVAQSCNRYFAELGASLPVDAFSRALISLGIRDAFVPDTPYIQDRARLWCGGHPDFRCAPASLMLALIASTGEDLWQISDGRLLPLAKHAALIAELGGSDPDRMQALEAAMADIRLGMGLTTREGTAKSAPGWRWPALVKTGSAPVPEGVGTDGWVFVQTPVLRPKSALLLYKSGARGKDAWRCAVGALGLIHP